MTDSTPGTGVDSPPVRTFPDGRTHRIEIPSIESPDALRAVIDAAERHDVPVHRVSQGSGISLLSDAEITEMARLGRDHGIEVVLFTTTRASWDVGAQARSAGGGTAAAAARGMGAVASAIDEIRRACDLGVTSFLVADLGLIALLGEMRTAGELPSELFMKLSVSFPCANAATAVVLERLGVGSLNLPSDLDLDTLQQIRSATGAYIDMYIETGDDLGGILRYVELPQIVRAASPIYLKFGLRNAPSLYPYGSHLDPTAARMAEAKVHRAARGLALLERLDDVAAVDPRRAAAAATAPTPLTASFAGGL